MKIWTAKFSAGRTVVLLLAAALVIGALFGVRERLSGGTVEPLPALVSNEDRVEYLRSLGWEVEPEPVESLQFRLPETLEEPYLSYNALQIPQGFDLADWCGQSVARYTYTVTNYPDRPTGVQANLYVCGERPIAGDILCPGASGFQQPLIQGRESLT